MHSPFFVSAACAQGSVTTDVSASTTVAIEELRLYFVLLLQPPPPPEPPAVLLLDPYGKSRVGGGFLDGWVRITGQNIFARFHDRNVPLLPLQQAQYILEDLLHRKYSKTYPGCSIPTPPS